MRSPLNGGKVVVYVGLIFPKDIGVLVGLFESALTMSPVPGVVNSMPRVNPLDGRLKKSPKYPLGTAALSGTASQLISLRPVVCEPDAFPLFGPKRFLNSSMDACISPAALIMVGFAAASSSEQAMNPAKQIGMRKRVKIRGKLLFMIGKFKGL